MSRIAVIIDGHRYEVEVNLLQHSGLNMTAVVNGEVLEVAVPSMESPAHMEWIMVNNRPYEIIVDNDLRWIKAYSGLHRLEVRDLDAAVRRPVSGDGRVKAPIPGLITRLQVAEGDEVQAGQPLLVLEAMKMENEVLAPRAGVVRRLNVRPGQSVALDEVLAEITAG